MPYEKTIGGDDFTFDGTLSSTPKTMYELLSPADQTELREALFKNGNMTPPLTKYRVAVDGWIYCTTAPFYTSHKVGGAEETVDINVRYPMPVFQWWRKRLFRGFDGQLVKIRILLSAKYDKRDDY
jgi:hypothetical protein